MWDIPPTAALLRGRAPAGPWERPGLPTLKRCLRWKASAVSVKADTSSPLEAVPSAGMVPALISQTRGRKSCVIAVDCKGPLR